MALGFGRGKGKGRPMVAVFFIIDGTRMEAQVALLAATMVHHNGSAFTYFGYVPDTHAPHLNPDFEELMQRCGVELRPLPGPSDVWASPYPHGNKILAATDWRGAPHSLFLDSDIICTAPLDLTGLLEHRAIAAAPEGKPTWGKDMADWESIYGQFNLPLPTERITLARGRRRDYLPYFNAGMILFPEGTILNDRSFAEAWLETALTIDHLVVVKKKRPWLDQISLPVTLKRYGLGFRLAPEALNFSVQDRLPSSADSPTLIHYHSFRDLAVWDQYRQAALTQTAVIAGDRLFSSLSALNAQWWHAPLPGPRESVAP
jgi:hypothetical protein